MNAIELLESQHREVEALFARLEDVRTLDEKEELFIELADRLAIHASIEEHHLYPTVREHRTEGIVAESLEEHLTIKRLLNRLLDTDAHDASFDADLRKLKTEVGHHVRTEEGDLFPRVQAIFAREELEVLAEAMLAEQDELERRGHPHEAIAEEVARADRH